MCCAFVTALPTPHIWAYIRRSRRTCPAVFQSIKSGFSCSIVFLAPQPIKSFDRAGAVDGNTIRTAIVDESRQIVLTQTQSVSVPPPPFDYLLYVVVVHCFVVLKTTIDLEKRNPGTTKPKTRGNRARSASVCFRVFGVGRPFHFGSMKTIVVTQATTRPFKRVKSTHFRKEKDHQPEHQHFVTLETKKNRS